MGNCTLKTEKKITVILLGLDNSGKTTTVKGLIGEAVDDVAPTWGFSSFQVRHGKYKVAIHDLGGGKNIRKIWRNYFAEAYGVIYVVDASDLLRVEECRDALHDILRHPKISGKPLLILANKQDVDGALDETDVCCALDVENLVNEAKICTRVEMCTAFKRNVKRQEKAIQEGFHWLVSVIGMNYTNLKLRVEEDTFTQRQIEINERIKREERVERLRAERKDDEEMGKTEDKDLADPFRPLTDIMHEIDGQKKVEGEIVNEFRHSPEEITKLEYDDDAKSLRPLSQKSRKSQASKQKSECLEFECNSPANTNTPGLVCTPTRQIIVAPISEDDAETFEEQVEDTTVVEDTMVSQSKGDCSELTELKTSQTPTRHFFTRNNKTAPSDVVV